jgi:hypothetical protein
MPAGLVVRIEELCYEKILIYVSFFVNENCGECGEGVLTGKVILLYNSIRKPDGPDQE